MMHEREKSDPAIGAGKPANNAEATSVADAAEPVEQRAGAKGNASEHSTHRTQGREPTCHRRRPTPRGGPEVTSGRLNERASSSKKRLR
jgi:hypothetical protein